MQRQIQILSIALGLFGLFLAGTSGAEDLDRVRRAVATQAAQQGIADPAVILLSVDGALAAVAVSTEEPGVLAERSRQAGARGNQPVAYMVLIKPGGTVNGPGTSRSTIQLEASGRSSLRLRSADGTASAQLRLDPGGARIHLREKKCKKWICKVAKKLVEAAVDILIEWAKDEILNEIAPGSGSAEWTDWLDRDDPGGSGDFETLRQFQEAGLVCAAPIAVECQTLSGESWEAAGQKYLCNLPQGGVCRNNDQRCLDYRVRLLCP